MEQIQQALSDFAWWVNIGILVPVLFTRYLSNTKATWAGMGVILLTIAIGNATILAPATTHAASQLASLFGLVVHGALGATFLSNWLCDGAT